jgi:ABC-type phosphate transport system ATPase subunit
MEVIELLQRLKEECTLLVVSHTYEQGRFGCLKKLVTSNSWTAENVPSDQVQNF